MGPCGPSALPARGVFCQTSRDVGVDQRNADLQFIPFSRPIHSLTMRVGLLFDVDYDAVAHRGLEKPGIDFDRAGFDLFRYPSKLGMIGFDFNRFAHQQAKRAQQLRWQGVLSHNELYGALSAALTAEISGLSGTSPESILACQHKLHARRVLSKICPAENLHHQELAWQDGEPAPEGLTYPCYVKPVRAAFSVLARRIGNPEELRRYMDFSWRERWVMQQLIDPFDRMVRQRLPQAGNAHRLMIEEPLRGPQYNLDGFVDHRGLHVLGVVDAVMYPGTQSFQRWELPSRLPAPVVTRAANVAKSFLSEVGFTHGFFNLEFFYDKARDRLTVIEFNPRLSSQFSDLYQRVYGLNPHAMALALATGQDPLQAPRTEPSARIAASLVWRTFSEHEVPPTPGPRARQAFAQALPNAHLFIFTKSGHALKRDLKWLESHRYGVVNLGGQDAEDIKAQSALASALLGWPNAPYALPQPALEVSGTVWAAR
jgi:hypothetical protein